MTFSLDTQVPIKPDIGTLHRFKPIKKQFFCNKYVEITKLLCYNAEYKYNDILVFQRKTLIMYKNDRKIITKAVIGGLLYTFMMDATFAIYWFLGEKYDRIVIAIIMIMFGLFYSSRKKSDTFNTISLAFTISTISVFIMIALSAVFPTPSKFIYNNFKPKDFEVSPVDMFMILEHDFTYIISSLLISISAMGFYKIKNHIYTKKSGN